MPITTEYDPAHGSSGIIIKGGQHFLQRRFFERGKELVQQHLDLFLS